MMNEGPVYTYYCHLTRSRPFVLSLQTPILKDLLESANPRFCHLLVLLYRASAYTYRPYNLTIAL